MPHKTKEQLSEQFDNAAYGLKNSDDKLVDLCRNIIDHPEFKDYAATAIGWEWQSTLTTAFNTLDPEETWKGLMAFIQTDAAIAIAQGHRPEYLVDFLARTEKKMTAEDKEVFDYFLWETRAGKALETNYPTARLKMMLARTHA